MDSELLRRVDALRRPLELAAKDGYAGVRTIAGLGPALRIACDALIARSPSNQELVDWREMLGRWDTLGELDQTKAVARGQRLLMRFGTAPPQLKEKIKAAAKVEPAVDPLAAPTSSLKGIGPALADRMAEKGLVTVEDLLWFLPRRYDDVRDARPLDELMGMEDGTRVTFIAQVASTRMVFVRGRRWAEVRLGNVDLTRPATALVRWFNMWSGIDKRMPVGSEVVLNGQVKFRSGRLELANPEILGIEIPGETAAAPPSIMPRYPEVLGVPPGSLRKACVAACARVASMADDGVPKHVEQAVGLCGLGDALARLHEPTPDMPPEQLVALNRGDSPWHKRLAFGELFALGVAVALRRRERRSDAAIPCGRIEPDEWARAFPFAPTKAQARVIDEIGADLARDVPMNRLLQGDVGSGKTAVAFAAAVQAARAGRQTAVMAPTALLAEQHLATWKVWAGKANLRVELLTGQTPQQVRASILAMLATGDIDVLIGTHALISEGVGFRALGLTVIDEQHRFGVAQRAKLRDKGDGQGAPHLLVMTATPIPRTLALTVFGDLDTSILDELPPGRKPITTKLVRGARGLQSAYKLVGERIAAGERAYVVCAKINPADGEDSTLTDAVTTHAGLLAKFPRTGIVHGQLDAARRDDVMQRFKTGELDALVATTVIEVGVDVPAATVMVIHDAERFGLAQLHQLRGRVGRGGVQSHCILVAGGGMNEDSERRLGALVATTDGFVIAEEDLALRGPGEMLGARQAGVPRLRFGDLQQHTQLLLEARRHADAILDGDPDLVRPEHAGLKQAIARRNARQVYGAEGG